MFCRCCSQTVVPPGECECYCCSGQIPRYMRVNIVNTQEDLPAFDWCVEDPGPEVNHCEGIAGEYLLDLVPCEPPLPGGSFYTCRWRYEFDLPREACQPTSINVDLSCTDEWVILDVTFCWSWPSCGPSGGAQCLRWSKQWTSAPNDEIDRINCMSFSSTPIEPYDDGLGGGFQGECVPCSPFTTEDAFLTAVP